MLIHSLILLLIHSFIHSTALSGAPTVCWAGSEGAGEREERGEPRPEPRGYQHARAMAFWYVPGGRNSACKVACACPLMAVSGRPRWSPGGTRQPPLSSRCGAQDGHCWLAQRGHCPPGSGLEWPIEAEQRRLGGPRCPERGWDLQGQAQGHLWPAPPPAAFCLQRLQP